MKNLCAAIILCSVMLVMRTTLLVAQQSVPYQGFDCQIYDRICSDPRQDRCVGYFGASIDGQFPQTFSPIWTPPSIGCLTHFSNCSAAPQEPPVGVTWFYRVKAYSPLGEMSECGPIPPPPLSNEVCAYLLTEFDFHSH